MRVGIIGAGITGLSAGYELCKNNVDVAILEASDDIGGIAGTMDLNGVPLERYYHHYFKSDAFFMSLIKELGIEDRMMWLPGSMGYFANGKLFDFGTPLSLFKFSPLRFIDKMKFGMAVLKILSSNNWQGLENITAENWILKNAGREVYEKVWKPLLVSKFGEQYNEISMAWLWGKIKLRGTSKESGREVLGYISGGNKLLLDRIGDEIGKRGGKIILNCHVDHIEKDGSFKVRSKDNTFFFDRIIDTTPLPVSLKTAGSILPDDYINEKKKIEYTAVTCMILVLDRPFTRYYWLNIGDESIPFGGLIEHTNLLDSAGYRNNHILYISNYVYRDSKYFNMDTGELLEEYIPHLKKINPSFDRSWIRNVYLYTDEYAQPVIKMGYSSIKPSLRTPVKGFYISNMCSIYPEDRGVNYALREGTGCAKLLMEEGR